ncbi:hypothetical protein GCM10010145_12100 [Streptomyces ruber]|uniref:Uncharacterized protein n=2 Tax=Streptomyces TaxID=1883 RepID=A0A918BBU2_9ACTN|nr:hypothetical protein [Streptomyces ruber]GGQ45000.1 hypothetical protein GCM10010145_12100 [Streptomyces ruber]
MQAIVGLTRAGRSREAPAAGDRLLALRPPLAVFGRLRAALGDTLWSPEGAEELRRRAGSALALGGVRPGTAARLAALRAPALSRGTDLTAARAAGETAR